MQYFEDVLGQERACRALLKALETDKIHHAYLFMGSAGVGKFLTARQFARAILLQDDPDADLFLRQDMHPDLLILEKPANKTMLLMEQITRELEPWLAVKPYRAAKRVAIIRDAHLLGQTAANALLKTLEEPPAYAIIIMVADENTLLETIVSRCQPLRFNSLGENVIVDYLQKQGIDEQAARRYARLGQGSMAVAAAFSQAEGEEDLWEIAWEILRRLAGGQESEVFQTAERMEKKPALLSAMLEILLRDLIVYQNSARSDLLILPENAEPIKTMKSVDADRVQKALLKMHRLRSLYRTAVNTLLININISYVLIDALK